MFEPFSDIIDWDGHYDKPLTKESVYHVTYDGKINISQFDGMQGYRNLYLAVMDASARELADRINRCKRIYSYNNAPGGSFCINEYGIVIVPIAGGYNNYVMPKAIGRWTGTLEFTDGRKFFSLDKDMKPGVVWPYPYLGMKYHLARRGYIYYNKDKTAFPRAPEGNDAIIRKLQEIRKGGPITFLVNDHGIVLTKSINGPVYVGRIDMGSWYPDPLAKNDIPDSLITQIIIALNKMSRTAWKDRQEYERILAAYWENGQRLTDIAMKRSLTIIANNHLK